MHGVAAELFPDLIDRRFHLHLAQDSLVGEVDAFLSSLRSDSILSRQRIEDYSIDAVNGNQPQFVALGIYTIIVKVRLLASLDTIVFETQIGETVEIEDEA